LREALVGSKKRKLRIVFRPHNIHHMGSSFINPYSDRYIAGNARKKRAALLLNIFPELASMRVLDLGGVAAMWEAMPAVPAEVVLLNPQAHPVPESGPFCSLAGDACNPPTALRQENFDLVFSNSVIEHVGGHYRRERFAETVNTVASQHWIQTPNRYFPIEPHWMFPCFQFLPTHAKAAVNRVWSAGHFRKAPAEPQKRMEWALEIELLTKREMAHYFPESKIACERMAGMTKSLVAIKTALS
jgi:hypothetical protein